MDNLKLEDWSGMDDHTPSFLREVQIISTSNTDHSTPANLHTQSIKAINQDLLSTEDQSSEAVPFSWLKVWIVLICILNMLLIYDAMSSLPYFKIQNIEFHNLKRLQKGSLLKDLGFDALHLNYFLVDTDLIVNHLKDNAWIKEAVVERKYPNQLEIFVKEKRAVAVTTLEQLTAIDKTGAPIAAISAKEAMSLPLISGVSSEFFAEGGDRHIGQRLLLRGIKIAELYQKSELNDLRALSEVYVSETGRIELMLQQTRVSLGTKHFESSLNHLKRIILHLKKRGVDASYILLSEDQTRAIVKEVPLKIDTSP